MTEIQLVQHEEQPTAVVHERVRLDEIRILFDRGLPAVVDAITRQGGHPAGPPFAKYFGVPDETIEVEVGFPVARPITPVGIVTTGTLPAGRVAQATHVGPYDTLPQTYDEMFAWMKEQGVEPSDEMWEVYLSDPSQQPDPQTWRTQIFWPVG